MPVSRPVVCLVSSVILACLPLAALAVTPVPPVAGPVPAGTPATSAPAVPLDPYARDLLARLNSEDTAQREAAQKQLASIAGLMQQPEILKRLQETAPDQDLKDFFAQRMVQIRAKEEEKRLSNLAPITLKLDNASLAQAASELNKALGNPPMSFIVENNGNPNSGTATIDVKEKPFWEVFASLQEQMGFEIQNYGGNQNPRLYPNNNRYPRKYAVSGPVMAVATGVNYQRNVNFQGPSTPSQSSLSVSFSFYVDPRIRASRFKNPSAVKVQDDQGHELTSPNNGNVNPGYNGGETMVYGMSVSIQPPDTLPKSVNLSFDAAVTTTVGDTKVTIDDISKNIDKPITVGNRTLRIVSMNDQGRGNRTMIQFDVQPINNDGGFGGGGVDYNSRIPITILDATGRVLTSTSMNYGSMGTQISTAGAQTPYKMEIAAPGRNFDIPVHFEFKDLPMP